MVQNHYFAEIDGKLSSNLQIESVELEDTGDYTCSVSNPVGTAFQVKRLDVRGMLTMR